MGSQGNEQEETERAEEGVRQGNRSELGLRRIQRGAGQRRDHERHESDESEVEKSERWEGVNGCEKEEGISWE